MPKCFLDGELRAIWCGLPKAKESVSPAPRNGETVGKVKGAGLNTLLIWTESVDTAAHCAEFKQASDGAWDVLGETIQAAKQHGLQVHVWYSPWVYKTVSLAVELKEHPDWAAVSAKGG